MQPELPYPDLRAVYSEVHQALLCLLLYLSSYLQSDPGADNKIRPQEQLLSPGGVSSEFYCRIHIDHKLKLQAVIQCYDIKRLASSLIIHHLNIYLFFGFTHIYSVNLSSKETKLIRLRHKSPALS